MFDQNRGIMKIMNADQVIEQIRRLSPEDQRKVERAFVDLKAEADADIESARRIKELRDGKVTPISEEDVVRAARAELGEG